MLFTTLPEHTCPLQTRDLQREKGGTERVRRVVVVRLLVFVGLRVVVVWSLLLVVGACVCSSFGNHC